jgi:KipI family sensor histidine kinase inhibitor
MADTPGGTATPRILTSGDQAVTVEFGAAIDPVINDRVYAFAEALTASAPEWLVEIVPTYRSLLVQYDPFATSHGEVIAALRALADAASGSSGASEARSQRVYELPVAYGGENGPDLAAVAGHAGLSEAEVIEIHGSAAYRVYMIGFSPGFPYLGGMDKRIACPRLKTPRTRVPAGSVGIAEAQTGVYPSASPGGWQLIGRTPVRLFDAAQDPPSVLQPGRFVRFFPVTPERFAEIEAQAADGSYRINVTEASR